MPRLSSLGRLMLIGGAAAMIATACGGTGGSGGGSPSQADVGSGSLTGAGSTFVAPFFQKAFYDYNAKYSQVTINYQPIGSGGGITAFKAKTVDFAASDVPMSAADIAAAGGDSALTQIPVALGVVSIAYTVNGVNKLQLDSQTLAGIFLGQIKKWNDPAIAALNAGVHLPNESITVFHRSDGSGTTYIFTDYLSKVSSEWKAKTGSPAKSISWPAGQGASGNQAVAQGISNTEGAIGYVELAYVVQTGMKQAYLKNEAGNYLQASTDGATAAAATNSNISATNFSVTDASCGNCYPITGFTWAILYTAYGDAGKGKAVVFLFDWLVGSGQADGKDLQYAPLPTGAEQLALSNLKKITAGGAAVLS